MGKMKSISIPSSSNTIRLLLTLTVLSCGIHLSFGFPYSDIKKSPDLVVKRLSPSQSQQQQTPRAITSSIKPNSNNNPGNSREFPSQSKSESTSRRMLEFSRSSTNIPLQLYKEYEKMTKNPQNWIHKSKSSSLPTDSTSSNSFGVPQLSLLPILTNGTRQIGNSSENRIPLHLHEKVNVQEEGEEDEDKVKVDVGGRRVRVTDVNTQFGFQTGLSAGLRLLPSIPLLPLTETKFHRHLDDTRANSDTNTVTRPLSNENGNVDGNSFTGNTNNLAKQLEQSFVIKKALPRKKNEEAHDEESRTQFSLKDNNKNKTKTNRSYIHPSSVGPGQNSKVEIVVPLREIQKEMKIQTYDTPIDANTRHFSTLTKNVQVVQRPETRVGDEDVGSDLYFQMVHVDGEASTFCYPVVVNQSVTFVNYGATSKTEQGDTSSYFKDVDKWTNIVKMSQCVAACLETLSFNQKYNMSPRKGINELGGSAKPVGISALAPNYNGDISSFQIHVGDKLLSTCQKSCKFLPQKSSNSPISITANWKQTEETNKANDASSPPSSSLVQGDEATSKTGGVSNHGKMPRVGFGGVRVKRRKNDKNSSDHVDAKNKTIVNKTTPKFHLHWPKLASSIKNKTTVIVYNVLMHLQNEDENENETHRQHHLLPPRWKLIDQTVAQQTQISFPYGSSCGVDINPKSVDDSPLHSSSEETIITPSWDFYYRSGGILVKVIAVGSKGLEKVFSGHLILMSSTSDEEKEDKSKLTLESTCCQSWRNVEMQNLHKMKKGISNPLRNPAPSKTVIIPNGENKNSYNVSFNSESGNFPFGESTKKPKPVKPHLNFTSEKKTLVILNRNKNSNIASNKINFKGSWASNKVPTYGGGKGRRKVSYKLESDPSTRGKIDTETTNEVEVNQQEHDANSSKSTTEKEHLSFTFSITDGTPKSAFSTFTTNSKLRLHKTSFTKTLTSTTGPKDENDWGLRTLSMVYQNFLVVTEVAWQVPVVPSGVSNQEEENAFGPFSSDKNNNATKESSNSRSVSVSQVESGYVGDFQENKKGRSKRRYQFLLTWEIFGGGLKGNLVTDATSGTISLWPNTAYYIQVGLIDSDSQGSGLLQPSSVGKPPLPLSSSSSSQEPDQHQNYMSNLLGVESIIFPLAEFSGGEPQVTLSSRRLLVNTSQLAIPKSSPSLSPRSPHQVVDVAIPRLDDSTRRKSNNPLGGEEEKSGSEGKYLHFQPRHLRQPNKDKVNGENGNVRPITIVSTNGNENSNGHFTKNKNRLSFHDEVGDLSSTDDENGPLKRLDTVLHKRNKKYYQKNGDAGETSSSHYMMRDSPGGKSLVRENDHQLEGENEKLHGQYYSETQQNHYLVGASNAKISTSTTTNGHEDKTANINDNKSNNNNSKKNIKNERNKKTRPTTTENSDQHHHHKHNDDASYRPEGYQGLFALNLGLGGYNYNYDHDEPEETGSEKFGGNNVTNSRNNHSSDTGAGVIYSVFVLIVVGCVIFLFLVAFIGFFVVTSSITQTAQYFIPKKLRIWVIGGSSESELLAGEINGDGETEQEGSLLDGSGFAEDVDDDMPEWGDDIVEVEVEGQHQHQRQQQPSPTSRRGQEVDMTHRDVIGIGRT